MLMIIYRAFKKFHIIWDVQGVSGKSISFSNLDQFLKKWSQVLTADIETTQNFMFHV